MEDPHGDGWVRHYAQVELNKESSRVVAAQAELRALRDKIEALRAPALLDDRQLAHEFPELWDAINNLLD